MFLDILSNIQGHFRPILIFQLLPQLIGFQISLASASSEANKSGVLVIAIRLY